MFKSERLGSWKFLCWEFLKLKVIILFFKYAASSVFNLIVRYALWKESRGIVSTITATLVLSEMTFLRHQVLMHFYSGMVDIKQSLKFFCHNITSRLFQVTVMIVYNLIPANWARFKHGLLYLHGRYGKVSRHT